MTGPPPVATEGLSDVAARLIHDFLVTTTRYAIANHNSSTERWYGEAMEGAREALSEYIKKLEAKP